MGKNTMHSYIHVDINTLNDIFTEWTLNMLLCSVDAVLFLGRD